MMQEPGRPRTVLVAMRPGVRQRSIVRHHVQRGDNVVVVHSREEGQSLSSTAFDHGIFGFELDGGGSALVLAGRLRAEGRLGSLEVVHPDDEPTAIGAFAASRPGLARCVADPLAPGRAAGH
jgi:hypothetical protein